MRAVILAGGLGRRLLPYTTLVPKPLMPIGGQKAILELILERLSKSGFEKVTLAVNHLSHLIQAYFGDGSKFGIEVEYMLESEPLGTMGPLRNVTDLPEHFLVMNGDILTDLDLKQFFDAHVSQERIFSISSFRRIQEVDFGVLEVNEEGTLRGFKEKPKIEFEVSMGIYAMSKRAIDFIPLEGPFGFDDLVLSLLKEKEDIGIIQHHGSWLDIGRPEDYDLANRLQSE
jgi:NDP-sugar pyrophosphorylase family protein